MNDEHAADGLAVAAWRMSQSFWGNGRKKIPASAFKALKNYQFLFEADLAIEHGSFVYVRGTRQFHEWYALRKESSAKGGKNKGNRPKQNASKPIANGKSLTLTLPLALTLKNKEEEKSESGISASPQSAIADPLQTKLVQIWNRERGSLPGVRILSSQRERKAKAAWARHPSEDFWVEIISRIRQSPFCSGKNERGWIAGFDFLLKPDTPARVLEGVYDSRNGSGLTAEQVEINRRMRDELDRKLQNTGE